MPVTQAQPVRPLALALSFALGASAFAVPWPIGHNPSYPVPGDWPADRLGASVSSAGDVNNDGWDDFVAGARHTNAGANEQGKVRVYSGRSGAPLRTFVGDGPGDALGFSVAGAGDVNDDGFDDIIAGAPGDDDNGPDSGSARVYSGANGAVLRTFFGDSMGDGFGHAVCGAGDVNDDGFADVAVGAPGDDDNGDECGSVRIFSGADGSVLRTFHGDNSGDRLGYAVAGAGDLNDDGFADIVAGAPWDDNGASGSGSARAYSGADGSVLYTFDGTEAGALFGASVAGAGDVNADGFDDVIVGALPEFVAGEVRVFSGADGAVLHTFTGDAPDDGFGVSVGGGRDANDDGYADLIVGADRDGTNGAGSGSARVFSGVDGSVLYTFRGDDEGDALGACVSGAGDLNNDGFADFVVGAPGEVTAGLDAGSVRAVLSGRAIGPIPPEPCSGDANGSRTVDFQDIVRVLAQWGVPCP